MYRLADFFLIFLYIEGFMRFIFCLIFTAISVSSMTACVSSETTTSNNPNSHSMAFDPKGAASTRVKLALLYIEKQQMQQAKENLDKALEYQPNDPNIYRIFAYYYQKVNEADKAENYYQKSLSLDAKNGDTYHNYGTFLCGIGDYHGAEEAFLKAVVQSNYNLVSRTYENAAICAEEDKNYKKAIFYYEYALSHSPKSNYINLSLAKLNISQADHHAAKLNLFTFERTSQPTAESLWQWVRLSYATSKEASLSKYAGLLLAQFPDSQQALNYLNNEYYD